MRGGMKKISIMLILMLVLSSCKTFDKGDWAMVTLIYATSAGDYYQTVDILDDPTMKELNPNINNDTDAMLFIFGGATAAIAIAALCENDLRKTLLGLFAGIKVQTIARNYTEMND